MMLLNNRLWIVSLLVILGSGVSAETESDDKKQQVQLLAPGYGELNFAAPEAGSYNLPVLGVAKDAKVLNADRKVISYHDLFEGKYTLLSFVYTRCNDVNGCPLTEVVYRRIKRIAKEDPILRKKLQLISMSFDPQYDTPEALKKLRQGSHAHHHEHHSEDKTHSDHAEHHDQIQQGRDEVDWFYLTTDSMAELEPILRDYDQTIQNQIDETGKQSENFSHILRVFLIDPEKNIRNIYSVAFLHPDIIINDIRTLLLQSGVSIDDKNNSLKKRHVRLGSGDSKQGYHSSNYKTDSLSLLTREGKEVDLLKLSKKVSLGLPIVPVPEDNPLTEEKIKLGKKLFFDRRLSLNDTISCAMCHIPEQGFTNNEIEKAVGFEGRSNRRNAPTILNVAYLKSLFHDARETTLEHQVWQPMLARNEMAMPSIGAVIEKIKKLPDYDHLFENAFAGQQANIVTIGKAIASYERTLISADSSFDRWYYGNNKSALTLAAQRGFKLFTGKGQCITCHIVSEDHALFTDNKLHNTGIGWHLAMGKQNKKEKMLIAPGHYITVKQSTRDKVGNPPIGDLGFYEVTQNPVDLWRYRTPTLRNIALSSPYMHDGSIGTLREVVEFYNIGGFKNKTLSPFIKPLNLSDTEINNLVEFLKSLTGSNVEALISDAFTIPIGDTEH